MRHLFVLTSLSLILGYLCPVAHATEPVTLIATRPLTPTNLGSHQLDDFLPIAGQVINLVGYPPSASAQRYILKKRSTEAEALRAQGHTIAITIEAFGAQGRSVGFVLLDDATAPGRPLTDTDGQTYPPIVFLPQ